MDELRNDRTERMIVPWATRKQEPAIPEDGLASVSPAEWPCPRTDIGNWYDEVPLSEDVLERAIKDCAKIHQGIGKWVDGPATVNTDAVIIPPGYTLITHSDQGPSRSYIA